MPEPEFAFPERGMLKDRRGNVQAYTVRPLAANDLEEWAAFQQQCLTRRREPFFQLLSMREMRDLLGEGGVVTAVFVDHSVAAGSRMIAFRAISRPGDSEENLGLDLGLSPSERQKVIHLEATLVDPDFRGQGLQRKLTAATLRLVPHPYRYIFATVSPQNVVSLRNLLRMGLQVACIKAKYGGQIRYICLRDVREKKRTGIVETVTLPLDEYAGQETFLNDNFRGCELRKEAGEYRLVLHRQA